MKFKQLSVQWTPNRLLFVAAACSFVLLVTLPASRWLVRGQSTPGFYAQSETGPWRQQNITEASWHPDDFLMQFAAALQKTAPYAAAEKHKGRAQAQALWALRARFPREPALYAAVMRYLTWQEVRVGRAEEQDLLLPRDAQVRYGVERSGKTPVEVPEIDSASTQLFLEAAAVGEQLDPQNSFFPMMQATALFATDADEKALAALHRAAQKPLWNDYASLEAIAGDKLTQAAHGETGVLGAMNRYGAVVYPHLAQQRATTRVAIALAVRKELAGDLRGGWTVRYDVAQCGAVMRNGASSYIGSLLGIAVTQVAMARPGGEKLEAAIRGADRKEKSRLRTERFLVYAGKIGRLEEAVFFRSESAASEETRALYSRVEAATLGNLFSMPRMTTMMALWTLGSALVPNIAVVLVLGGIAFGLARTPRIRSGRPLHPAVRWGIAAATVPIPFAIVGMLYVDKEGAVAGFAAVFLAVTSAALGILARGKGRRRNLLIFIATLPLMAATLSIIALGSVPAFLMAKDMARTLGLVDFGVVPAFLMVIGVGAFFGLGSGHPLNGLPGVIWVLLPVFGGVVFHAVWLAFLAIHARHRRVPVSVGMVRGVAGGALTTASVLLFVYAAVTVLTLRAERQGLGELGEITRHEGRYYARLAGKPWPGLPAKQ